MSSIRQTLRRAIVRAAVLLYCSVGALSACGLSELPYFNAEAVDAGADVTFSSETGPVPVVPATPTDAAPTDGATADASATDAQDDASSVGTQDAADEAGSPCGSCTTPPTTCFTSPGTCSGSVCVYAQQASGTPCAGNNQCDSVGSCGGCLCLVKECYRGLCTEGAGAACVYVPAPVDTKCGFLTLGRCDGQGKCSL